MIQGTRNSGKGTVAIDAVKVTSGACPARGSNNFENGFNTFINEQTTGIDNFDWVIRAGATSSPGTGPAKDHTLNKGTGKVFTMLIACDTTII